MQVECEIIKLSLITEADLELMREWRNADHVNRQMEFRAMIDADSQQRWFKELDKKTNFYLRLDVNEVPIGILHLKNINWDNKVAEAGIFVGDEKHLGTMSPMFAVVILMKLAFDVFQLNHLIAKIADANVNAIQFNKSLGYVFEKSLNPGFSQYMCSPSNFYHSDTEFSKVHALFNRNAVIKIALGRDAEWLLPMMNEEAEGFHFRLL